MSATRLSTIVLAAIGVVAAMYGCAVGPRWRPPAAPAGTGYAPMPLPQTSSSSPVHGGEAQDFVAGRDIAFEWWELFQSPALNALIERAFNANPTIAAAQAAVAQAQELVSAQRGSYFPTVAGAYRAERHKVSGNTNASSTIGVQGNGENKLPVLPEVFPNPYPHNLPSYYSFHTAELTVGFVPDVFGGNRRQVEALAAQADAQRFALEATYITLASNVVAAATQEASLRAQMAAIREIIGAEEKSLRILRDQFRLGSATRIDVAAQEAALAQAEAGLPPLQAQYEQTRDLIRALVGELPNAAEATLEFAALQLPQELPVSLPAKIIQQRPDVRAAEAQLHAANAGVGVAVAAMLPQFSITGQSGGGATEIPWMFRRGGPFWNIFGNVSQPAFEGGALLHRTRAAREALVQAAAQYQGTVIAAYQNVADVLHASLSDAEAFAADVEAENSARATYELTRRQMEVGYASYLALLSAQTAYQQTVLTRVQAQAIRYGDTVALFQALGGGWWNRDKVAAR